MCTISFTARCSVSRPCPPCGWGAAASFCARVSRNGSAQAKNTPDKCYDPIEPDDRRRRTERTNVHRQRHQKGSLQVRQHGDRKMWVLLYRDGDTRKYATLGQYSKMSKSEAQAKRDELIAEANARNAKAPDPQITFGEFLNGVALPFLRSKWKRSTAAT